MPVVVMFSAALLLSIGFARIEIHSSSPLLDVRVFSSRAFSISALAIATNFFCLFGFIFLTTQYFQMVRGYTALSAGVHTLPFAGAVVVATPLGALAALRFGPRAIVAQGLTLTAVALFWMATLGARTAYAGPIVGAMVVLAIGFSLVNAPSTAALMGTLSAEQMGAGAAVNETTRELGGTLGVAVIGSVFSSVFGPDIHRLLAPFLGRGISRSTLSVAQDSMQAALKVAANAPMVQRVVLRERVVSGFMDGLHRGCVVAGAGSLAIALIVFLALPRAAEVKIAPKMVVFN